VRSEQAGGEIFEVVGWGGMGGWLEGVTQYLCTPELELGATVSAP
jgi:hypothetical protein